MAEWRAVVGFEGLYEVSSEGQIRGLEKVGLDGRVVPAHIKRLRNGRGTYLQVSLRDRSGEKKSYLVHRLVAFAFKGMPGPGQIALHADGSRRNNAASNLRWGSHVDNARDRKMHGTGPKLKPEAHKGKGLRDYSYKSPLTAVVRERIADLRAAGEPIDAIAKWLSLNRKTVMKATNNFGHLSLSPQSVALS